LVDKYIITAKIPHGDIQKMAGMNKRRKYWLVSSCSTTFHKTSIPTYLMG
jgi:hypothetical protein